MCVVHSTGDIKMRCPLCERSFGYLRHIGKPNQEWVCRVCGTVTPTEEDHSEDDLTEWKPDRDRFKPFPNVPVHHPTIMEDIYD